MKLLARFFLCVLLAICTLRAEPPAKPVAVLPVGSRVFLDATVRRLDAFTARITHATGTATVPAWELSDAQQRNFGFDPAAIATEVARRAAIKQAAADALRRAEEERMAAAEKARKQKEEDEASNERIAAANREVERRDAAVHNAARAKLGALLHDETAWRKDGILKRLHDLNLLIAKAVENLRVMEERQRSRAVLMASPGDQLAAAALAGHQGRFSAAEFSVFSPETKRQIETFVPEKLPEMPHTGPLGAWEIERDRIESGVLQQFANEIRASGQVVR